MKHLLSALVIGFSAVALNAQEHYSGLNTSLRTGFIHSGLNPAELVNLRSSYEVQLIGFSLYGTNNKVSFSDINGDRDFEELLFSGADAVNMRIDAQINGPGFAFRTENWAFALSSRATIKADLVDVDVRLGEAIANSETFAIAQTFINNDFNQRVSAVSYGEIGFTAARKLLHSGAHKLSGGATVKLLFPGSYANFGADEFSGSIVQNAGQLSLQNTSATLNFAYSGNLADDFTEAGQYTKSVFGKPNGFGADIGLNYRFQSAESDRYVLNAGVSVRNIGAMTFSDANNASTNYSLDIGPGESLNLNQFDEVENLREAEQILLASGFLDRTQNNSRDFKVKLPTVLTLYADYNVYRSLYVSALYKQPLTDDAANDQITNQRVISVTPRLSLNHFEIWSSWSDGEFAGLTGGLGFRVYGFFIGSGSVLTALASDAKQADVYIGYSFGWR